jgi:hypothetical protein
MRMIAVTLVLLASTPAALALAAAPPGAAQGWMVGAWFGHGQPQDKGAMYIDRMRADGSWRGEYRTCIKGKSVDQTQTGRWSVSGDILILSVEMVDGVRSPRIDNYKMLSHSPTAQKYLSMGWNYAYSPQRVADDFRMPSCELTS